MRHEMNRIQSKVHNIGTYGIKISLSSYSDQKIYIYLKMDTVGFHIFVNVLLLVNACVHYFSFLLFY